MFWKQRMYHLKSYTKKSLDEQESWFLLPCLDKNLGFCLLVLIMKHCLYNPTKPFRTNSLTRKEPKPSEIKAFIKTPKNLQRSHAFVQHNLLSLYKPLFNFHQKEVSSLYIIIIFKNQEWLMGR